MDTIYGTCDAYCQAIGCVCIGAWDDDLDTCGEQWKLYLSRLLNIFVQIAKCICPNCQAIGRVWIRPRDNDLDTWAASRFVQIAKCICPDCWMYLSKVQNVIFQIANNICPNCKLYLSKFKWSGELGYHNCAHDFGSYTSDAICECNPQPNGTCPSGAFKVPKVPLRCLRCL